MKKLCQYNKKILNVMYRTDARQTHDVIKTPRRHEVSHFAKFNVKRNFLSLSKVLNKLVAIFNTLLVERGVITVFIFYFCVKLFDGKQMDFVQHEVCCLL